MILMVGILIAVSLICGCIDSPDPQVRVTIKDTLVIDDIKIIVTTDNATIFLDKSVDLNTFEIGKTYLVRIDRGSPRIIDESVSLVIAENIREIQ
jgi:hypothetical protein